MDLANALVHHLLGGDALLIGLARRLGRTLGAHRHFVGGGGHLVDRGGDLVGFVSLAGHGLLGTLRLAGHRAHHAGQLGGGTGDLAYQQMNLLDEAVEGAGQFTEFVLAGNRQAMCEVALALCHVVQTDFDQQQRPQYGVAHEHRENRHQYQQRRGRAEHDGHQNIDALLELGVRLFDVALDVVEVERGAECQLPLRQVLGITDLGHQGTAGGQPEAVIDVMAAVLRRRHQLTDGIDAIRVAEVVEALADLVAGVAVQNAHGLVVIAPEIAVLAVRQALEDRHCLVARLHVAVGRGVVDRRQRIARELHVVLQFGTAVADQALSGVLLLLLGKVTQLIHGDAAEHDRQEQDRPEGQQQEFRAKSKIRKHGIYL